MKFEGEHLLPGQIGHFFILLSFVAAIIATISFFKAIFTKNRYANINHQYKRAIAS